jgi:site-specific DNA-methyltransferase (adenine-specific)/modification methylase
MKFFCIDDVCLVHADCRDILPGMPPGGVYITDPVWPNVPEGLIPGHDRPFELFGETMASLVEPKRIAIVMRTDSDPRILSSVPTSLPFLRTIELPYAVPAPRGRILMGGDVAYVWGPPTKWHKNRQLVPGRGPAAQPTPRKIGHPCPRPQQHCDWILDRLSDADEAIIDPFVGSGTLAISALRQGRTFIGIEIDEAYFKLACKRLEFASRQSEMSFNGIPLDTFREGFIRAC